MRTRRHLNSIGQRQFESPDELRKAGALVVDVADHCEHGVNRKPISTYPPRKHLTAPPLPETPARSLDRPAATPKPVCRDAFEKQLIPEPTVDTASFERHCLANVDAYQETVQHGVRDWNELPMPALSSSGQKTKCAAIKLRTEEKLNSPINRGPALDRGKWCRAVGGGARAEPTNFLWNFPQQVRRRNRPRRTRRYVPLP